jgi:hypothetical protein
MHSSARANSEAVKATTPLKIGAVFLFLNLVLWWELRPELSPAGAALYSRSMAGCSLNEIDQKCKMDRTMWIRARNALICFFVNSLVANCFIAKKARNYTDSSRLEPDFRWLLPMV